MTIESIEDEAAGVDRTTKKVIAWHLDGIEGVGRFQDARVVMRVVAVRAEPVPKAQLAREIEAAAGVESVNCASAWNNASAKRRVGLGTRTGTQGEAGKRLPAGIEKTCLIVATRMETGD